MICKNNNTGFLYNYSFIKDGMVYLENTHLKDYPISLIVKYEDWINEYYVVDKWNLL